jgi:hypothetical protein
MDPDVPHPEILTMTTRMTHIPVIDTTYGRERILAIPIDRSIPVLDSSLDSSLSIKPTTP